MHPIVLYEPSFALKIAVAAVCVVALFFFVRAYRRNGRL
jgi:hypothetical protein